ncbi:MAG: helix-hairpin-helix domain-containing protein, partial [Caldilineaceae bacterium]|nr:helix-hairpin-helix domain-containing protein [Caldilineaceae bacterium]
YTNLLLYVHPKLACAEANLQQNPIEVNQASRPELLRIPGIGPKLADLILHSRTQGALTEMTHLRRLGLRNQETTARFILLNGRQPDQQLSLFAGL